MCRKAFAIDVGRIGPDAVSSVTRNESVVILSATRFALTGASQDKSSDRNPAARFGGSLLRSWSHFFRRKDASIRARSVKIYRVKRVQRNKRISGLPTRAQRRHADGPSTYLGD
ncbi:hypothetical protein KCU85_g402, partial [Aureobasidium melanogenum]